MKTCIHPTARIQEGRGNVLAMRGKRARAGLRACNFPVNDQVNAEVSGGSVGLPDPPRRRQQDRPNRFVARLLQVLDMRKRKRLIGCPAGEKRKCWAISAALLEPFRERSSDAAHVSGVRRVRECLVGGLGVWLSLDR
jgi:hypothetical protein